MNKTYRNRKLFWNALLIVLALSLLYPFAGMPAWARQDSADRPALIITHNPVPEKLRKNLYIKPVKIKEINSSDITDSYYEPVETPVGKKVVDLGRELNLIQNDVVSLSADLAALQKENEKKSAEYYAAVATISTQLQSGTTPGNPRLARRMFEAENNLDNLGNSITKLNQLATDTANIASGASFLLESTRAAYNLSGAIEEDHVKLAELEDAVNNTMVIIERVLNNVSDDITRTTGYLNSERNNLRTLSLAVTNGDLYGKSLANRPFSSAGKFQVATSSEVSVIAPTSPPVPLQLVRIRFDRPDVKYEQLVYMAVSEALDRYPDARFDLVAVHPSQGNAAEVAIESTRARRNAERVLRTLTQMGLPLDRIDLSYSESVEASTSEVHIFVR